MKKALYTLPLLTLLLLTFASCSEREEAGEYDNWKSRNQHYIDSIATLAHQGRDGWTKMLAYNLIDTVEAKSPDANHWIYIQRLATGTGSYRPQFCDSIRIHYIGRLIPTAEHPQGYVFGKSYVSYTLNEATDVPTLMAVRDNVVGMCTATMHMVEGDQWRIVIPHYLGYGENQNSGSSIPGYSALIFDVKLAKVYRYGIDSGTTWH